MTVTPITLGARGYKQNGIRMFQVSWKEQPGEF
jgi:hypothetical protein